MTKYRRYFIRKREECAIVNANTAAEALKRLEAEEWDETEITDDDLQQETDWVDSPEEWLAEAQDYDEPAETKEEQETIKKEVV